MSKNKELSQEYLKSILNYDLDTGVFTWKITHGIIKPNSIAGSLCHGYVRISICNKKYRAHHLAWLYVHGCFPVACIDHINHVRDDNRMCNLRECSIKENHKNKSKPLTNTSGVCGVHWHKKTKKWYAQIWVNGKNNHLGLFENISLAKSARESAKLKFNFHKNHGEVYV